MALNLRPDNVKDEIDYIIHGYNLYDPAENLFNGSTTEVYSGVYHGTSQRKTLPRTYWASGTGASLNYLDIEFLDDVRIWDAGGDAFPTQVGELNIYTNTEGVKGILYGQLLKYTQSSYNSTSPNWQTVAELPKGRYRIESTGTSVRISNEWYLEKLSATNKTLILHDGEYKYYTNKKTMKETKLEYETTSELFPIDMTSANTPSPFIATSNSEENSNRLGWRTFSTSDTSSWKGDPSNLPAWVSIYLGETITLSRITMKHEGVTGPSGMPKTLQIQGSTDGSSYTTIKTFNNLTWDSSEIKTLEVNASVGYSYYRFYMTEHNGNSSQITFGKIKMYKTSVTEKYVDYYYNIEVNPPILEILNTIPTTADFLLKGMDSLSPLLDRRVETLEPQPMTDISNELQGEEGKLFSKTIDLKKYIDIRNIKVEVK